MTPLSALTLPQAAVRAITTEVAAYGQHDLEHGGFLLLANTAHVVSLVAVAGANGITRHRNLFQISAEALDRLFTFADDRELWIAAQFHSHGEDHGAAAFLSPTDADHGLRAEGFTSVVIPGYRNPPADTRRWGWWRFTAGRWKRVNGIGVGEGAVELVRFDEAGVHAW